MSLRNLVGISLEVVTPDKAQVARLLAASERNISDAQLPGLSVENRFDAAYKAIMQLAMVALHARGFRTLTSKPGHHQTAIQTLTLTVAIEQRQVLVLDTLRKQRNLADYSGEPVTESAAAACLVSAQELRERVLRWLATHAPDLSE